MDIMKIPLSELIDDKYASIMDVKLCEWAIVHGHTEYGDGKSMQSRLDSNQNIIEKIEMELKRRYVNSLADLVNNWPNGDGPVLLVRKLRTSAFPLTDNQIVVALEAIESTCHKCWNVDISGDRQCNCGCDE